eukprot:1100186-Prorocentrum_lima.AAC.1
MSGFAECFVGQSDKQSYGTTWARLCSDSEHPLCRSWLILRAVSFCSGRCVVCLLYTSDAADDM